MRSLTAHVGVWYIAGSEAQKRNIGGRVVANNFSFDTIAVTHFK